jgi:hypothetical protein
MGFGLFLTLSILGFSLMSIGALLEVFSSNPDSSYIQKSKKWFIAIGLIITLGLILWTVLAP